MKISRSAVDLARRATLAALACAVLAPAAVCAQDPRATTVQRAAREWLALADNLDAAATWNTAGPYFQQALTLARWTAVMSRDRAPRGAVVRRAIAKTSFATTFPGLPAGGTYALVTYRTSFAQRPDGLEQLSLELAADGVWRVIGYVIR